VGDYCSGIYKAKDKLLGFKPEHEKQLEVMLSKPRSLSVLMDRTMNDANILEHTDLNSLYEDMKKQIAHETTAKMEKQAKDYKATIHDLEKNSRKRSVS